jgi:putative oxidoreductase
MENVLGRYSEQTYALMRMVVGVLFASHGAQKLLGWFGGSAAEMNVLLYLAGAIELLGGLLIAAGLFAATAAFLASGTMAFAYFMAHHSTDAPLPIQNRGELAAVYAWVFLFIATRGSGVWSVDAAMAGGAPSPDPP